MTGTRPLAVVASVVALGSCCAIVGLSPASAAAASHAREFVPKSYPRKLGGACRKGGEPWGNRCWARCPRTHATLRSAFEEGIMSGAGEVRCVRRRKTRLFYGLKLTAEYYSEHGNVVIGAGVSQPDDRRYQDIVRHSWTFRPRNEAVVLFRQCTMRSSEHQRGNLDELVDPAIPCERHHRALQPLRPPFSLSEDVSLRTAGRLDGGDLSSVYTEDLLDTYWYESGRRISVPCFNAATYTTTGSGPSGMSAVLRTPARSVRFHGLALEIEGGGPRAPLAEAGTGRLCPPLPAGAKGNPDPFVFDPPTSPTKPFVAQPTGLFLDRPKGTEILSLFKPNLDQKFGDARIELHDTVEQGVDNDPPHGTYKRLDVTLELTRCRRQAPPSRCGVRR